MPEFQPAHPAFELVHFVHGSILKKQLVNYPSRPVINHDLHLMHLVHGKGHVRVGRKEILFDAQSVVFVPPFTEYRFFLTNADRIELLNIHFFLRLENGLSIHELQNLPVKFKPQNLKKIQANLRKWHGQWKTGNPVGKARVISNLAGLAAGYFEAFGKPRKGPKTRDPEMDRLVQLLNDKAEPRFSAERFAGKVYLSVSQMNRRFRRAFGMTPFDYWQGIRLDWAKSLLLNSRTDVKSLAEQTGFPDQNYFSRWFRKNTGLSPTRFRTNGQNEDLVEGRIF